MATKTKTQNPSIPLKIIAEEIGKDPKQIRRFLRKSEEFTKTPNGWVFTESEARRLKEIYSS